MQRSLPDKWGKGCRIFLGEVCNPYHRGGKYGFAWKFWCTISTKFPPTVGLNLVKISSELKIIHWGIFLQFRMASCLVFYFIQCLTPTTAFYFSLSMFELFLRKGLKWLGSKPPNLQPKPTQPATLFGATHGRSRFPVSVLKYFIVWFQRLAGRFRGKISDHFYVR